MKVNYKGFEIEVTRDKPILGEGTILCYTVYRIEDNLELVNACEDITDTVRDMIKILKEDIDNWLINGKNDPDAFGE